MVSNFLQSMAQKQAKEIDKEFGANAHGGSEWLQQNTQVEMCIRDRYRGTHGTSGYLGSKSGPPRSAER